MTRNTKPTPLAVLFLLLLYRQHTANARHRRQHYGSRRSSGSNPACSK